MIRGKEKRRSKNYKSFVGSNRTNGRREFHRMGSEFLKALEYTEYGNFIRVSGDNERSILVTKIR